jgi:hypothetical protein
MLILTAFVQRPLSSQERRWLVTGTYRDSDSSHHFLLIVTVRIARCPHAERMYIRIQHPTWHALTRIAFRLFCCCCTGCGFLGMVLAFMILAFLIEPYAPCFYMFVRPCPCPCPCASVCMWVWVSGWMDGLVDFPVAWEVPRDGNVLCRVCLRNHHTRSHLAYSLPDNHLILLHLAYSLPDNHLIRLHLAYSSPSSRAFLRFLQMYFLTH